MDSDSATSSVGELETSLNNLQLHNEENQSPPRSKFITSSLMISPSEIRSLAKEDSGITYLLESLSQRDTTIVNNIFHALSHSVTDIMCHKTGYRLFAKLVKSCTHRQLQLIVLQVTSNTSLFHQASVDVYGSRSINTLITVASRAPDSVSSPLLEFITSALTRIFRQLMTNRIGFSIISHCQKSLKYQHNEEICRAAVESFYEICCDKYGCICMNNFIDEMHGPRRRQVLELIPMNSSSLSRDQYGNFVIQHILGLNNPGVDNSICRSLQGQVSELSMMKEGSYIVELMVRKPGLVQFVVEDILSSGRIVQVANDRYGNYVIQTALKEVMELDLSLYRKLATSLMKRDRYACRTVYGKKVYEFITGCGIPVPR